jgi:hypothetical protein
LARSSPSKLAGVADLLVRPAVFAPILAVLAMAVSALLVNRGAPTSDEGVVLAWAGKILRGGVFYRDINAYQFPGSAYLLAGWMWLFGESVNAARWLAAWVFCGLLLGLFLTATQLLDRRRAALCGLGLLSFKVFASPAFTTFMYSDLSLCFASFAIALLVGHTYRGASIRLVAAGALVACATASKQNLGIYLAGASMLLLAFSPRLLGASEPGLRRRLSELGGFTLGLLLVAAPTLGYFASKGLLPNLILSGVLRPLLRYLPTSGVSFTDPLAWWNFGELSGNAGFPYFIAPYWSLLKKGQLPMEALYPAYWAAGEFVARAIYTSVPVAFFLAFARWSRAIGARRFGEGERRASAFAFLALAVFLSAFPRADFFHVMSVYPVVFLLWFVIGCPRNQETGDPESRTPAPRLAGCAVAILLVAAGSLAVAQQREKTYRMHLTRADLYIEPSKSWIEPVVNYVEETLEPGEPLFVYGNDAFYYFLTGHYYAWPFAQVYPGQVGGNQGMPLVRVLQRRPPSLVVRGVMNWPGVPVIEDYAKALYYYVAVNYPVYRDFFVQHPPPAGEEPPDWAVSVLRPRARR